jgi:sugar phosphate isomerase/epimerase
MISSQKSRGESRREFLVAGAAATGALALGNRAILGRALISPSNEYGPFKMGLQSYSLRGLTSEGRPDRKKALATTQGLGLHYWEAFPAHIPLTEDKNVIRRVKQDLEANGVRLNGYGVVPLGRDEAANRRYFEFAREMGATYLSADPDPDCFDKLDRLVEEYGIGVGIHNHGPGHRYALIDTIAKAIKDHDPKIGCCIDTGHFLRSKEDPVRAVEAFGKRIYGVHLKDVKNAETFTILGQGDLRTVDLLRALAANSYEHCLAIEYEEKPEDPVEDIKACLAETRRAVSAMAPS